LQIFLESILAYVQTELWKHTASIWNEWNWSAWTFRFHRWLFVYSFTIMNWFWKEIWSKIWRVCVTFPVTAFKDYTLLQTRLWDEIFFLSKRDRGPYSILKHCWSLSFEHITGLRTLTHEHITCFWTLSDKHIFDSRASPSQLVSSFWFLSYEHIFDSGISPSKLVYGSWALSHEHVLNSWVCAPKHICASFWSDSAE
jgi:hypothetical protein